MSQRRLKLSLINLIFHYIMSILLTWMTAMMFYKLFTENFPPWLEWQRTNLICSGTIFLGAALYFIKRDYLKLEFHPIDLNGYDGKLAIQQLSELLTNQGWNIKIKNDNHLVANGYSLNTKFRLSAQEKLLTLMISDNQLLINCIVEPPVSFRATFGGTDEVVNDLITEFIKISSKTT